MVDIDDQSITYSKPMASPLGFRFATAAALIDREGYTGPEAENVLHEWERYARYAMLSGKSPASTAEHLARFERYQRGPSLRDMRRGRPVSSEHVDRAIADDLRRHASIIERRDRTHADAIYGVATFVERGYDPRIDKPHVAASILERERDARRLRDPGDEDDEGFRCSMCRAPLGGCSLMTPDGRAVCSRRCKDAGVMLPKGDPFAQTEPGIRRRRHS